MRRVPSTRSGKGAGSLRAGGSSSSSNGRSNRSLMGGELGELVQTVTQALDVRRASRFFVGVYENGVQPGIAGGDFEARGKAGEKAIQRRLDLHADDGVVRSGHAGVGQVRSALRKNPLIGRLHMRMRADDGG